MLTTAWFFSAAKWAGISTLGFAALAVLAFVFQWGLRFRLVGVTGFMGVLTGGLFALSLVPLTHTVIPGAAKFSVIYDNGASLTAIAVSPTITESELDATLRQAAGDLFSYGRLGQGNDQFIIRARTVLHPQEGVSQPLLLGQVKRALSTRDDSQMVIEIDRENIAKLPKAVAKSA
jgi:hypothetical protein